jgi:opacity protein-like surface antigen
MKVLLMAAAVTLITAAPLLAQTTERGYVSGLGGFAASPDTTSGNLLVEGGVRIAPHLLVFGSVGEFHNRQPSDAQSAVDSTTAMLSVAQGLGVVGTPRVPAWYSMGGLRYDVPMQARVSPYVLGGLGVARLTPTAQFTYANGTLPDGTTPAVGTDVTADLVTAGDFTAPPAWRS